MPWVDVLMAKEKNNPITSSLALVGDFPIGVLIDSEGVVYARYITPDDVDMIMKELSKRK
jgi:hypothetical protein